MIGTATVGLLGAPYSAWRRWLTVPAVGSAAMRARPCSLRYACPVQAMEAHEGVFDVPCAREGSLARPQAAAGIERGLWLDLKLLLEEKGDYEML